MTLADACLQDLLPIATTIAQEAVVCSRLAADQGDVWDPEASQLIAFTFSSGVSQLLHLQRAMLIEALDLEMAEALDPA